MLFSNFPVLKKAYDLKKRYISFNETCYIEKANDKYAALIEAFVDSNIEEYTEFYNLLINWFQEFVNSFSTVSGKRINNSYIKSKNNQLDNCFSMQMVVSLTSSELCTEFYMMLTNFTYIKFKHKKVIQRLLKMVDSIFLNTLNHIRFIA